MNQSFQEYIARPKQLLSEHLCNTACNSSSFSQKIGLLICGSLLGLLHDLGKYSELFQRYIGSIAGNIDIDNFEYIDPKGAKGRIDHSSAGAQWIWNQIRSNDTEKAFVQILALCIASHHSGLIDCLSPDGINKYDDRMKKLDEKTHLTECLTKISDENKDAWLTMLGLAKNELASKVSSIAKHSRKQEVAMHLHLGLLTRYLLSCLVDADRLDSAGRKIEGKADWNSLIEKLNTKLESYTEVSKVNDARVSISQSCFDSSSLPQATFFLTVPTGGGKTLSSLRFALHHAKKHDLDRIIYVVPYTSIIEQNANEVRSLLQELGDTNVLEHHSNLTPDKDTEANRLWSENWDASIVFTTTVQLLETLFSSGTRGVRRMHRLAKSVIIFDEPQAIPIKVTHMFNQAVNFLTEQCHSTVVLCTATQPLLHKVSEAYGAIKMHKTQSDLVPNFKDHFGTLKRVSVTCNISAEGFTNQELAYLIIQKISSRSSLLFVANTKAVARGVFELCRSNCPANVEIYHLSTNMCPAHRHDIFERVKKSLKGNGLLHERKIICISTQLIEAGVDISFTAVIRSLAGLDSITQAAGRCNRNGEMPSLGEVTIVKCKEENLGCLKEIEIAQQKTERVMREFKECELLSVEAIARYYDLYFYERANEMTYPIDGDNLLSQLSTNDLAVSSYFKNNQREYPDIFLRQSFASAGKAFEVIDAPTEGIVVPYNEVARRIIGDLCGEQYDPCRTKDLLKKAQRYSVNLFASDKMRLAEGNAISETQEGSGIYFLDARFYDETYGICYNGNAKQPLLQIDEN